MSIQLSYLSAIFLLVYFGIGIYIFYFFRKRFHGRFEGQGYKFPAIIYFISVPLIIAIGTNFFNDYNPSQVLTFEVDVMFKIALLYAILPTIVYISIGLYILSLEYKKGPGYKLPALIYFISVPSLVVIGITMIFGLNYISGRYEQPNKPAGYELYKFLVLKDIIPRSGQSIDEEEELKVVEKKEEKTTEETKVEKKKEETEKPIEKKIVNFTKYKHENVNSINQFSLELPFKKIRYLKNKKSSESSFDDLFISFDVEFDNFTARVNAYNDTFYGSSSIGQITKIGFSYFDNYGKAQNAQIEVYDNNPKNYALSLSNSDGRYFSKMNFLTHKGKLISITELKYSQRYDGTIFIINEEDNNGKFYSIKSAGKDSVSSANLVEFDDYYDVEKDLGNESFYSYFEKENLILDAWVELLKEKEEDDENDLIYYQNSEILLGSCQKIEEETDKKNLSAMNCNQVKQILDNYQIPNYEENFINKVLKEFSKKINQTVGDDKIIDNLNYVEIDKKLLEYLNNYYPSKESSNTYDLIHQSAGKKIQSHLFLPDVDWEKMAKIIQSYRGSERYTVYLQSIFGLTTINMFLNFYDNGIKKIGYFSNDYEKSLVRLSKNLNADSLETSKKSLDDFANATPDEFIEELKRQNYVYRYREKITNYNKKDNTPPEVIFFFLYEDTKKNEFVLTAFSDSFKNEKGIKQILFKTKFSNSDYMIDPINLGEICKNPNNKIKNCNKDYYEYIEDFFEAFRDLRTMEALWYEEIKNSVLSNNNIVKLNNEEKPVQNSFKTDENYYALVIGNNNYQYLEKLDAAENDAKVIADILENKYGFEVELLLNGDYSTTVNSIFNMTKKLKENDNLLIYYAGHGELDKSENRGYWLPVNASTKSRAEWISNQRIVDRVKATKAKHVLLMVDSCFSGSLMRGGELSEENETIDKKYIERLKKKKTRLVITSGGNEPVVDSDGGNHSLFALKLIDTLKNNDNVINSQILFENIRRYVVANADQTPERAMVHKTGHDGGDFLFFPK